MRDFLTLKMLPLALSLIKPEKRHLFAPLVKDTQKMQNMLVRNIEKQEKQSNE